jgi:hypothetical protein
MKAIKNNIMRKALKSDWKLKPFPKKYALLTVVRMFDDSRMERLKMGMIPESMDDKWFVYSESNTLYFHRSWTGIGVFEVTFKEVEEGCWRISECRVSRDLEEYGVTDNWSDAETVSTLLDDILMNG